MAKRAEAIIAIDIDCIPMACLVDRETAIAITTWKVERPTKIRDLPIAMR